MRKDRIASLLHQEISKIVERDIRDPRLPLLTITEVVVSRDLKNAVVYFTTLGNKSVALDILQKAKGYIKGVLAHHIRIRFMPEIEFKLDETYEKTRRLNELFKKISKTNKE
jgi:ribosome-binding factor A